MESCSRETRLTAASKLDGSCSGPTCFALCLNQPKVLTLLKVMHGDMISRSAKPLCSIACFISPVSSGLFPEKARATKVAPEARASKAGLTGLAPTPSGWMGVENSGEEVGEACPLVRP